jgi:RNA polymerase sigma-70 factor (ECF subfamily)
LPHNAAVRSTSVTSRDKTRAPAGTKQKQKQKKQEERPPASEREAAATADATEPLSDLELIEGIRRESEGHFNELYNRYFQRIYNFVYGRIRSHADTEEIVQETFTVVFSSIEKYSGRSSLLSWIYGIAKNTTNNNLRQAKNTAQRMQEIGHDPFRPTKSFSSCTPEEQLSIQHYLRDVVDQLDDFGDWQVEIFEMRHLQNLSIREISKRTQRSSDSVRSSLYRVKRVLMETAAHDSPATP